LYVALLGVLEAPVQVPHLEANRAWLRGAKTKSARQASGARSSVFVPSCRSASRRPYPISNENFARKPTVADPRETAGNAASTSRSLLDGLLEADEVLVEVGALDQARAVRDALAVLEALNGASVTFEEDASKREAI
jgi:hypothetical protein